MITRDDIEDFVHDGEIILPQREPAPRLRTCKERRDLIDAWFHCWSVPAAMWLDLMRQMHTQVRGTRV